MQVPDTAPAAVPPVRLLAALWQPSTAGERSPAAPGSVTAGLGHSRALPAPQRTRPEEAEPGAAPRLPASPGPCPGPRPLPAVWPGLRSPQGWARSDPAAPSSSRPFPHRLVPQRAPAGRDRPGRGGSPRRHSRRLLLPLLLRGRRLRLAGPPQPQWPPAAPRRPRQACAR